jgi:hypothetical protein
VTTTPDVADPALAGLRESLCHYPAQTLPEVLLWVAFAVRCVRETPPGFASSAVGMVADPRIQAAFEAAVAWLDRPSPDALPLDASDAALRAASAAGGLDPRAALGVQAAVWAVACAVASATYAATVGTATEDAARALRDEEARSDSARYALLAASCAVQAADAGKWDDAIRFQAGLMREVWGLSRPGDAAPPAEAPSANEASAP